MNHYCYFACLKKERSTAKRLFDEIGNQWRSEAWGNQGVTGRMKPPASWWKDRDATRNRHL
jgi:hypothetical protein